MLMILCAFCLSQEPVSDAWKPFSKGSVSEYSVRYSREGKIVGSARESRTLVENAKGGRSVETEVNGKKSAFPLLSPEPEEGRFRRAVEEEEIRIGNARYKCSVFRRQDGAGTVIEWRNGEIPGGIARRVEDNDGHKKTMQVEGLADKVKVGDDEVTCWKVSHEVARGAAVVESKTVWLSEAVPGHEVKSEVVTGNIKIERMLTRYKAEKE